MDTMIDGVNYAAKLVEGEELPKGVYRIGKKYFIGLPPPPAGEYGADYPCRLEVFPGQIVVHPSGDKAPFGCSEVEFSAMSSPAVTPQEDLPTTDAPAAHAEEVPSAHADETAKVA